MSTLHTKQNIAWINQESLLYKKKWITTIMQESKSSNSPRKKSKSYTNSYKKKKKKKKRSKIFSRKFNTNYSLLVMITTPCMIKILLEILWEKVEEWKGKSYEKMKGYWNNEI